MAFDRGLVTILATLARIWRGLNTTLRRRLQNGERSLVSGGRVWSRSLWRSSRQRPSPGFCAIRIGLPMSEGMVRGGPSAGCCLVPKDGDYCRSSARERFNNLGFTLESHALSL
jgi:hypothetical protein